MVRHCVGFVVLAIASASSVTLAQDRELARQTFQEAERQFAAANYQLALDGFLRSRELVEGDDRAQALILFNIGRAQEELGRFREAEQSFSGFLRDAPSDAPYREETLDRVRELRARLAAQSEADGSSEAAGGLAREPSGPSPLVPVGIAVLGVGAAVALVSVPTGVLALDGASTLEQRCAAGDCAPADASLIDETHALSIATDVLWVSGLSIAAIGGVLLAVGLTASDGAPVEASAACLPDRGCHATLRGRF